MNDTAMTASYYFWKWADNDLPGPPEEVHAALLRGKMHAAIQPFDPAKLLKQFEKDAARDRKKGGEWDWQVVWDEEPDCAKFVFVTLPEPPSEGKEYLRVWKQCYTACVFGWRDDEERCFPGSMPKKHLWKPGEGDEVWDPDESLLSELLEGLTASGEGGQAMLCNRNDDYIQVAALAGRFTVEWHECRYTQRWGDYEQWQGRYKQPGRTMKGRRIVRRFVPRDLEVVRFLEGQWCFRYSKTREFELICASDVLALLRCFLRGESRPQHFQWISLTEELKNYQETYLPWIDIDSFMEEEAS